MRDEFLERVEFETVSDAPPKRKWFRRYYNAVRPHSSLGYATPKEFSSSCDKRRTGHRVATPINIPKYVRSLNELPFQVDQKMGSRPEIWAYCLMPNHVHLIAVPHSADGLRRAIGEVHRRYTRAVNFREGWRGHLWQGRFASFGTETRTQLVSDYNESKFGWYHVI